jgi:sulfite exporter TauE/SafE
MQRDRDAGFNLHGEPILPRSRPVDGAPRIECARPPGPRCARHERSRETPTDGAAHDEVAVAGFLLGLATGPSCLAFCAPVLVPYLLAEGQGPGRSASLLGRFLLGRLLGYLLFGLAAGLVGSLLAAGPAREGLFGVVYLGLAVVLLGYGLRQARSASCAVGGGGGVVRRLRARWPAVLPVLLGLLTGLNLCPPFALAIAGAAETGSVAASILFFAAFFLGTSLFFLPLPGLGGLRRFEALGTVARLAVAVVGVYYLYRGSILVYGGLVSS